MKSVTRNRILVIVIPILAVLTTIVAARLLLRYVTFPPCPFYKLTHIYCPGCGNTRMVRALLQGNLLLAVRQNAMPFLLFGGFVPFYIEFAVSFWKPGFTIKLIHNRWVLAAFGVVLVAYAVARNFIPAIAPVTLTHFGS